MDAPTFDLQSHSTHSDGELTPAQVVHTAVAAGVEVLALTDHDSVGGVPEAIGAAHHHGLTLVTGTEISVIDPSAPDLHMCAYRIDIEDQPLLRRLRRSRGDREARAWRMTDKLRELGWEIDEAKLTARIATGGAIGRPHIAEAVVGNPANAERLQAEGIDGPTPFLVAYLIPGKPGFSPRRGPTAVEAIELIHGAGGLAVWAHPFWDIKDPDVVGATISRFAQAGLDGIEVFYVTHTREQTEFLVARCSELGLITTGSSDFHGPSHRRFSRFRAFDTYGFDVNLGPLAG